MLWSAVQAKRIVETYSTISKRIREICKPPRTDGPSKHVTNDRLIRRHSRLLFLPLTHDHGPSTQARSAFDDDELARDPARHFQEVGHGNHLGLLWVDRIARSRGQ